MLESALKVVEVDLVEVVEADEGTVSATNAMNMGISPANAEKNKTGATVATVLATSPGIVSKHLTDHPATTVTRLVTLHVIAQNHQTVLVVVDPVALARAITATRRGTLHATVRRDLLPKVAFSVARLAT